MATEISGVGLNYYPVVGQVAPASSSNVSGVSDSNFVPVSDGVGNLQSSSATQVANTFATLQTQQDALGGAASVVRDMAGVMNQASGLFDQVSQNLAVIVKMYPPYPVGSAQRAAILNEVSGLRKQIEQLTFPPPESLKLMDQVLGPQAGSANSSDVQGAEASVKRGVSGLAALEPSSASDVAVGQALDQVDSLRSKLQDVSTKMWRDVTALVVPSGSSNAQGADVGKQLATQKNLGIGSNAALLQQVVATN